MRDRYLDFEELRPTGEASRIPDTRQDDGCEGAPRRQRVAASAGGHPDRDCERIPPPPTGGEGQAPTVNCDVHGRTYKFSHANK
ncbi:hypothetical protein DJ68_07925 [Halorubrum sp. C3]|nr:hypothetical protein DJ68_07925 [Halorubrum sp. C3]